MSSYISVKDLDYYLAIRKSDMSFFLQFAYVISLSISSINKVVPESSILFLFFVISKCNKLLEETVKKNTKVQAEVCLKREEYTEKRSMLVCVLRIIRSPTPVLCIYLYLGLTLLAAPP